MVVWIIANEWYTGDHPASLDDGLHCKLHAKSMQALTGLHRGPARHRFDDEVEVCRVGDPALQDGAGDVSSIHTHQE